MSENIELIATDSNRPRYRGDIYEEAERVFAWREYFRQRIPCGSSGYVIEDLDLLMRRFYPGIDRKGKFMKVEIKRYPADLDRAQVNTFGLEDEILRKGDPDENHYWGFLLIQTLGEKPEDCDEVICNGKRVSLDDLIGHLKFERLICEPRRFG